MKKRGKKVLNECLKGALTEALRRFEGAIVGVFIIVRDAGDDRVVVRRSVMFRDGTRSSRGWYLVVTEDLTDALNRKTVYDFVSVYEFNTKAQVTAAREYIMAAVATVTKETK